MRRNSGFVRRDIAGESIIVPCGERVAEINGLFSLNDVGTAIWELLARDCSLQDIAILITTRYGISEERAVKDAGAFIEEMRNLGLLNND
jgi:hypothetical protein